MKWLRGFKDSVYSGLSKDVVSDLFEEIRDEFALKSEIEFYDILVSDETRPNTTELTFKLEERIKVKLSLKYQKPYFSVDDFVKIGTIKRSPKFVELFDELKETLVSWGFRTESPIINESWIEIIIKKI